MRSHYYTQYTPVIKLALTSTDSFTSRTRPFDREFSERIVALLREVQATGSLKAAARSCALGYTAAWEMVHETEKALDMKLLSTSTRGGSKLTDEAEEFLKTYTELEDYLVRQMIKWWKDRREKAERS